MTACEGAARRDDGGARFCSPLTQRMPYFEACRRLGRRLQPTKGAQASLQHLPHLGHHYLIVSLSLLACTWHTHAGSLAGWQAGHRQVCHAGLASCRPNGKQVPHQPAPPSEARVARLSSLIARQTPQPMRELCQCTAPMAAAPRLPSTRAGDQCRSGWGWSERHRGRSRAAHPMPLVSAGHTSKLRSVSPRRSSSTRLPAWLDGVTLPSLCTGSAAVPLGTADGL